ncbi:MAG: hypothetical protein JWQ98_1261 [Chlorobi bacterium]|nr:hypothetical protein [Chlorobiota bacterium]
MMALAILAGGVLASCSDSPVDGTSTVQPGPSSTQAAVTMQAELVASGVGDPAYRRWTILSGSNVDSLTVSRVRILVSNLKLHRVDDEGFEDGGHDEQERGEHTLKLGPMMITIDSVGTRQFAVGTIPAGTYDRVKFEVHRLDRGDVSTFLADPVFADFVTDDRYTVLIDGRVFRDGQAFPYTYRSDVTANLEFRQEPLLAFAGGSNATIMVHVDPASIFARKSGILDPRDKSNRNEIDNAIRSAFRAFRR